MRGCEEDIRAELRKELGVYAHFSPAPAPDAHYQIDYFNKRRVLAEQQQGIIAQAQNQARGR